jgi:hypothetical protein
MLWRRVILGVLGSVLLLLCVLGVAVWTSAEDKGEVSGSSESQSKSGAKAESEVPNNPLADEEIIEIPLNGIWGHDRSLRGLEPELFIKRDTPEKRAEYSTPEKLQEIRDKAESSLVYQIERAMSNDVLDTDPDFEKRQPAPGFAVVGRGREALAGIHEVVIGGEEPQRTFSSDDDISLVFFTLTTNAGVGLTHAERIGTNIDVQYVLIITGTLGMSPRLYIIPVGKLPAGKYQVSFVRALEEEPKYARRGFSTYEEGIEKSFVCMPFYFVVSEKGPGRKGEEQ